MGKFGIHHYVLHKRLFAICLNITPTIFDLTNQTDNYGRSFINCVENQVTIELVWAENAAPFYCTISR